MNGATLTFATTLLSILLVTCCIGDYSFGYPYDYVCNNGTRFACVCYDGDDSLTNVYPKCKTFISSSSLPVAKISVEASSDEGQEKFEEYFKRRIVASIITRYCMNGTHNCLGTTLPVGEDNVVVLKISCDERRRSSIFYTILKPTFAKVLTTNNTMKPDKINFILNATFFHFPHLLGPLTVVDQSAAELKGMGVDNPAHSPVEHFYQNIVFFIFLIVVGFVVGLIYIVAILKVLRDRRRRRESRKNERNPKPDGPSATNYGAINHTELQRPSATPSLNVPTVKLQVVPDYQAPPAFYIAPLRVGDVDAYEAAEPELHDSDSVNSIFTYLMERFNGKSLITKTTSSNNVQLSTPRQDSKIKKSTTIHHLPSSSSATVKQSKEHSIMYKSVEPVERPCKVSIYYKPSDDIVQIKAPEIKIFDAERSDDSSNEISSDNRVETTSDSRGETWNNRDESWNNRDATNWDDSRDSGDQSWSGGGNVHVVDVEICNKPDDQEFVADFGQFNGKEQAEGADWSLGVNNNLAETLHEVDNMRNSLSAAAILTTSYTEENLIKSEVSSAADSNSDSESDISEHSLLQPISDYQPLRDSAWSINRVPSEERQSVERVKLNS